MAELVRVFNENGQGFKLTPEEAKRFVAVNEGFDIETAEEADIETKEETRGRTAGKTAAARKSTKATGEESKAETTE